MGRPRGRRFSYWVANAILVLCGVAMALSVASAASDWDKEFHALDMKTWRNRLANVLPEATMKQAAFDRALSACIAILMERKERNSPTTPEAQDAHVASCLERRGFPEYQRAVTVGISREPDQPAVLKLCQSEASSKFPGTFPEGHESWGRRNLETMACLDSRDYLAAANQVSATSTLVAERICKQSMGITQEPDPRRDPNRFGVYHRCVNDVRFGLREPGTRAPK